MKNNKGFTVVELILSFTLVMVITIGLVAIVNNYRQKQEKETARRDLVAYKNIVLETIYNDVSKLKVKSISSSVGTSTSCTATMAGCVTYSENLTINFMNNTSKTLIIQYTSVRIDDDGTTFTYPSFNIIYDGQQYPNPIPKFADIVSYQSVLTSKTTGSNIIYKISIPIGHQLLKDSIKIELVIPAM